MIVCHCNAITDRDIRAAVDWMRAADARTIITPGKVYRALGKSPTCMDCAPLLTLRIYATAQEVIVAEGLLRGDAHPRRIK